MNIFLIKEWKMENILNLYTNKSFYKELELFL